MKIKFIFTIMLISSVLPPVFGQPYTTWTNSASIQINTTPTWANVTGTVQDFPIVVVLGNNIVSDALAGGADIRFATADGATPLPYEIEFWSDEGLNATVWVLIPEITGNAVQEINVYWGNSSATSESDGSAVFTSANGFSAVWHLGEEASEISGMYLDATGNGLNGTGTATASAFGSVGRGQAFNGTSSYIEIAGSAGNPLVNLPEDGIYVFSGWARPTEQIGNQPLIAKGDAQYSLALLEQHGWEYADVQDGEGWEVSRTAAIMNEWQYVVGVSNGTEQILYLNGEVADANSSLATAGVTRKESYPIQIGSNAQYSDRRFNGMIDEVRVSTALRTADWIKLNYQNQKLGQSLVSLPLIDGCTEAMSVPATATMDEGSLVTLGTIDCALKADWYLVQGATETPYNLQSLNTIRTSTEVVVNIRVKVLFAAGWQEQDVAITIVDAIPSPELTLTSPLAAGEEWDGNVDLTIIPIIPNLAAVEASIDPVINYTWTLSGLTATITDRGDTLLLTRANTSGTLNVKLCVDNGADAVCQNFDIEVVKITGTVYSEAFPVKPLEIQGDFLKWNQFARIKIWNLDGKLIWDKTGEKGSELRLSSEARRILKRQPKLTEVTILNP